MISIAIPVLQYCNKKMSILQWPASIVDAIAILFTSIANNPVTQ